MEPPSSFEADAVRDEKIKLLRAIQPMTPEEILARTVRGQYGAGSIDSRKVAGYRSQSQVSPTSSTETFAAMKLSIDNWRWAEVPFYLRTGKRLPKRVSEIVVQFKRAPFQLFRKTKVGHLTANRLSSKFNRKKEYRYLSVRRFRAPACGSVPSPWTFNTRSTSGIDPALAMKPCSTTACWAT